MRRYFVLSSFILLSSISCQKKGGDSGSTIILPPTPTVDLQAPPTSLPGTPAATTLNITYGVKSIVLSWVNISDATSYKVYEKATSSSSYTQIGSDQTSTSYTKTVAVWTHDWANASYRVDACNGIGCTPSNVVTTAGASLQAIGSLTASNAATDYFGSAVSISGDGNTIAVGAYLEDSAATGINGNQADNSAADAGAVYIFTRVGTTWTEQAYIKASNTASGDNFGYAIGLSTDGNTLAVGAFHEDSSATGINGNQADNAAANSGAVYVFARSGATWSQQAYIKASNTGASDDLGYSLALSGDGNTLAVGAVLEASNATGVNGNQADNSLGSAGAVYVFVRSGTTWSQQAYVKASNTGASDYFGGSVALSRDGNTLAVGAYQEDSSATGINGNQASNASVDSGAVYVFTRSGVTWSQEAYVKASNAGGYFGFSVALSSDGNTLAAGALFEDSGATGIDGNQSDTSAANAGAAYLFTRSGSAWSQQAYIKASTTAASDEFGAALSLSDDGNTLAVAAVGEDSNATGINGNQSDNSAGNSGAVFMFSRAGSTWSQSAYVKAPVTSSLFGNSVSLSSAGDSCLVGSLGDHAYLY